MDPLPTISISQVLSEIRASSDHTAPFLLRIVVGTGRSRGSIRTLAKCLKGFGTTDQPVEKAATGQGQSKLKEHDTIPVVDLEDKNHSFKTILISHIIGYNQYRVMH